MCFARPVDRLSLKCLEDCLAETTGCFGPTTAPWVRSLGLPLGFRVQGSGFRVQGLGFRVCCDMA